MSKTVVITTRINPVTLAQLDAIAQRRERTRAWVIDRAVRKFVEEETRFHTFLQEGEDSIDRGDFLTQEQMEAWLEQRYRAADAA